VPGQAPALPLHYFKRVPLLPRIQWAQVGWKIPPGWRVCGENLFAKHSIHLATVPVLYAGPWDERHIRSLYTPNWNGDELEGYVVRLVGAFTYGQFRRAVAKYVRTDHIRTRLHWWHGQPVTRNELAGSDPQ